MALSRSSHRTQHTLPSPLSLPISVCSVFQRCPSFFVGLVMTGLVLVAVLCAVYLMMASTRKALEEEGDRCVVHCYELCTMGCGKGMLFSGGCGVGGGALALVTGGCVSFSAVHRKLRLVSCALS